MTQPSEQAPADTQAPAGATPQARADTTPDALDQVQLDPFKVRHLQEHIRSEQNLSLALFAGIGAALIGASAWAMVTVVTSFQIGWMAMGVGFLAGWAVRRFGQGIDKTFGMIGAAMALIGCLAGNLLSTCVLLARELEVGLGQVLINLDPASTMELVVATFHPMDVLFYGIAVYAGYRFSFRRITEDEAKKLTA